MKISNSKKELARIISENGGWRDGNYAAQDRDDKKVWFMRALAGRPDGASFWPGVKSRGIPYSKVLTNWHQTALSREEYFHLYPSPDTDGWIEWGGGNERPVKGRVDIKNRNGFVVDGADSFIVGWGHDGTFRDIIAYRLHKPAADKPERIAIEPEPTIEQLAAYYRNAKDYADRKQQEADDARADAEAKLAELVAAGEALGLVVSVAGAEPELVINDWRDLRVGDEVECVDYDTEHRFGVVRSIDKRAASQWVEVLHPNMDVSWPSNWCFIRRP